MLNENQLLLLENQWAEKTNLNNYSSGNLYIDLEKANDPVTQYNNHYEAKNKDTNISLAGVAN